MGCNNAADGKLSQASQPVTPTDGILRGESKGESLRADQTFQEYRLWLSKLDLLCESISTRKLEIQTTTTTLIIIPVRACF